MEGKLFGFSPDWHKNSGPYFTCNHLKGCVGGLSKSRVWWNIPHTRNQLHARSNFQNAGCLRGPARVPTSSLCRRLAAIGGRPSCRHSISLNGRERAIRSELGENFACFVDALSFPCPLYSPRPHSEGRSIPSLAKFVRRMSVRACSEQCPNQV